MQHRTLEEVEEALQLLQQGNDKFEHEYDNTEAAEQVTKRFGIPEEYIDKCPSIGIPTFEYGQEVLYFITDLLISEAAK
jgi:hypothetical protein